MKLTDKILLIALAIMIICFTVFRIMFNNRIELVPPPYIHGIMDTTYAMGTISAFEIKGNYSVEFFKSEYDSIKINGPDNLIDKYTIIEKNGKNLSIISKIDLSKYPFTIKISIYTKNVGSVNAGKGSIVTLERFMNSSIEVFAEDSSIVNAEVCSFVNVKASTKDRAIISIENTKNAMVNILDSSSVFLTVDNGEIRGTVNKKGELILLGNVKSNTVLKRGKEIVKGESK